MITGQIIGDKAFIARLEKISPVMHREVLTSTRMLAAVLTRYVKSQKLSGQVLKNRTGNLRRSINYQIEDFADKITGIVGTNASYAHAHEYSFHGAVMVKEHMRNQTMAWGRPMTPRQVMVRSHSMQMNLPERSFMRSALREMSPEIQAEYERAMNRAINE